MTRLRLAIRNAAVAVFRFFGTDVIDQRTGKRVGRAFFFGWKGRVIMIGLENEPPLRPIVLPQERLTYWKQEIGFTSFPLPDFPSAPSPDLRSGESAIVPSTDDSPHPPDPPSAL